MTLQNELLRITLYRLHPALRNEEKIVDYFTGLCGDNFFSFQVMGYYDLGIAYPTNLKDNFAYNEALDGVRSYSNIDCICCKDVGQIIQTLKKNRILSIVTSSAKEKHLATNGGIICNNFKEKIGNSGIYLNSMSWGEQVALFTSNEMKPIWINSSKYINDTVDHTFETNIIFGINSTLIEDLTHTPNIWSEKIHPGCSIFWKVDLLNIAGALRKFHTSLKKAKKEYPFSFQFFNKKKSIDNKSISYGIRKGQWGELISTIKKVRDESSDIILSSRLNFFQQDNFKF